MSDFQIVLVRKHGRIHFLKKISIDARSIACLRSTNKNALNDLGYQLTCILIKVAVAVRLIEMIPRYSCASVELWMHLGSWESAREATEALLRLVPPRPRSNFEIGGTH